jgi:amidophosphoribosyltransferase
MVLRVMSDHEEECGVAAVFMKKRDGNSKKVPKLLDLMLTPIQKRGQAGTGAAVYKDVKDRYGEPIFTRKKMESVFSFFGGMNPSKSRNIVRGLKSVSGIGHVRYPTSQGSNKMNIVRASLQPFYNRSGRSSGRFAFGLNGNLANYVELEKELVGDGFDLRTGTDTELMMHTFSDVLPKEGLSFFEMMKRATPKFDGAYSLVFLLGNGDVGLMRDLLGIKPLVYGETEDYFVAASESVSLDAVGVSDFSVVPPGHGVLFSEGGIKVQEILTPKSPTHCQFEGVYFENIGSHFEEISIYEIRSNWGTNLAKTEELESLIRENKEDIMIVPVPETPLPTAVAFANYFGTSSVSAIDKITAQRGFIAGNKSERTSLMDRNYKVVSPEMLKDKYVFLIEDSIVRSETIKKVSALVRDCNPKEIHVRVIEPPVLHPCFYGINFPTYGELIANKYDSSELEVRIAEDIGVNSVRFQSIEGLREGFGSYGDKICTACLNGDYPTSFGIVRAKEAREIYDASKTSNV